MTYDEINPVLREFFGTREGFRKLGFKPEDLFLLIARSAANNGLLSCFCQVDAQNNSFLVECGPIDDEAAFLENFKKASDAITKSIPQADLDRIWDESQFNLRAVEILAALVIKGFKIPKLLS